MPTPLQQPPAPAFDLPGFLAEKTDAVNAALLRFLPKPATKPATIHRAMHYSLFAGGKRMRPAVCLAAAAACGGFIGFGLGAMPVGLAVMRRLATRFGDTPRALLAVTLAASLFTDTANALAVNAFFGWLGR